MCYIKNNLKVYIFLFIAMKPKVILTIKENLEERKEEKEEEKKNKCSIPKLYMP